MLTPEQKVVLKADVLLDPALNTLPPSNASADVIKEAYNTLGAYIVWRTYLEEHDITGLTSDEATVWDWTAYINTSVAEKMAWERIFNSTNSINPSLPQVRTGIADIFNGPSGLGQRTHLLAMSKRPATRAEELFSQKIAAGTTSAPDNLTFEGNISQDDVTLAMGW